MDLITSLALLVIGGGIMIVGGEFLVRGASRLACLFGVPPLIVGLTIVAACTSAPELTVSLMGLFREGGSPDVAVGNVVGSNIFNILFILGLSAMICPIRTASELIKREIPLMILVSFLFWGISVISSQPSDGESDVAVVHSFPIWGGVLFLTLFVVYNVWLIRNLRTDKSDPIKEEYSKEPPVSSKPRSAFGEFSISFLLFAIGLTFLVFGSDQFIGGATGIAKIAHVSDLIISLTIIAMGTSLPELVVSGVAALRGKNDIAIGNVVGSNLFNLLCILGVTSVLARGGLRVSNAVITFNLPVMAAVALVGGILCFTGRKVTKAEGFLLMAGYIAYVVYLILFSV